MVCSALPRSASFLLTFDHKSIKNIADVKPNLRELLGGLVEFPAFARICNPSLELGRVGITCVLTHA